MYKAGYDPNAFVAFFEKVAVGRKEAARNDSEDFLDAPADAGAHQGFAERDRNDSAGSARNTS